MTPQIISETDRFGFSHRMPRLGIIGDKVDYVQRNPAGALWYGAEETWNLTRVTLKAVWQMITGRRSSEELGGPVGIMRKVGRGGAGRLLPDAVVHGGAVGQSRPDQPFPDSCP